MLANARDDIRKSGLHFRQRLPSLADSYLAVSFVDRHIQLLVDVEQLERGILLDESSSCVVAHDWGHQSCSF